VHISYLLKIFCNSSITNLSFILIIRDASYTTQPLELLNALGFDSASLKSFDNEEVDGNTFDVRDSGNVHLLPSANTGPDATAGNLNAAVRLDHHRESGSQINVNGSEG
jgi:guanine nucleotide-exchange factor